MPEVPEAGHSNVKPEKFAMCFINFLPRWCSQELHADIWYREQCCAKDIDNDVKVWAELFRFGTLPSIDRPEVASSLPFHLKVHGCNDIDNKDQSCNDRATAKDDFSFRSPCPPSLSLWMSWISFWEPRGQVFQCCKARTVVYCGQDGCRH